MSPITVASGTFAFSVLVTNVALTSIGFQGHIARTRGFVAARPTTAAQDPILTWGIGLFDVGLTVASQFPDPLLEPRDPYFAWGAVYGGNAALFDMSAAQIMRVDSKGKRRYNDSDRVVLVLREAGSGHSIEVYADLDVLVIPDQGK